MFATRAIGREWEIIKWIVILTLAGALAMFWAMQTAGAALPEPARLPDDAQTARPMAPDAVDPNALLWKAVEQHRAAQPEEALKAWQIAALPYETEVWKQIAMGVAQLQLGMLEEAAENLMLAEDLEPENPVVHYYLGLLRLDQARGAKEWYDAIGPAKMRFAAYRPHVVTPNTRGMYELVAMQEFETAIENADMLDRGMVLAMPDHRVAVTLAPVTVGDLMLALGCEKFEGQAHHMLGAMYLDRGATDAAEEHMDAAKAAGVALVLDYRELGAAYEAEGRYGDAARAYLKGIENQPGLVLPIRKFLENAGRALLD
jgi:tetratricopeptide (TPR) repeat protein